MSTLEERAASSDHPTLLKVPASATFTSFMRSARSRVCHFTSRWWIFQSCAHYSRLTDDGCQNESANCYSSILLILFGRDHGVQMGSPPWRSMKNPVGTETFLSFKITCQGKWKWADIAFYDWYWYRSFFPICVISDSGSIHKAISLYILLLFDSIAKWTFNYNNKSQYEL